MECVQSDQLALSGWLISLRDGISVFANSADFLQEKQLDSLCEWKVLLFSSCFVFDSATIIDAYIMWAIIWTFWGATTQV